MAIDYWQINIVGLKVLQSQKCPLGWSCLNGFFCRFIYITRPLRYISIVTTRRALLAVVLAWTANIITTTLIMVLGSHVDSTQTCLMRNVIHRIGFLFIMVQLVLWTFCIVVPLYVKIACMSYNLRKTEPDLCHFPPERQAEQKEKLRERKMATTMAWVLGTYLVCYLPAAAYSTAVTMLYDPPYPFWILVGSRILNVVYKMQCCLNPFIYGYKNHNFRVAYKKLLGQGSTVSPLTGN